MKFMCCQDVAWLDARCPPKPPYRSPSSTFFFFPSAGEKKYYERLVGQDKDRGNHSPIAITGKTDSA